MLLKGSFKRGDEKIYLTQVQDYENLYYFVRTCDDDIFKRINEKSITVGEISDNLDVNEKIAFASYIYICPKRQIIACASGMSCPRFDDFCEYINELFRKVELVNYEFNIDALTFNSTKQDLLKMEMVNSVYVDIAADKGAGKLIAEALMGKDTPGLGNFKIVIEPSGTNMKDAFKTMLAHLAPRGNPSATKGVISIGAKAKHDELKGQLLDYWLDNESNLVDPLNPRRKKKLPEQVTAKFDENSNLTSLYDAYVSNRKLKLRTDVLLDAYKHVSTFDNLSGSARFIKDAMDNNDDVVIPIASGLA